MDAGKTWMGVSKHGKSSQGWETVCSVYKLHARYCNYWLAWSLDEFCKPIYNSWTGWEKTCRKSSFTMIISGYLCLDVLSRVCCRLHCHSAGHSLVAAQSHSGHRVTHLLVIYTHYIVTRIWPVPNWNEMTRVEKNGRCEVVCYHKDTGI